MSLEALSVTLTGRTSKLADEEVFLLSRIVGGPEKSPWMQKLKCQALGSTQSDESPLMPGVGKNVAFIACCQEVCLISAVPVHSTLFSPQILCAHFPGVACGYVWASLLK